MSRGAGGRAAVGLAANVAMVVLLVPRSLPRPDLLDPASRAAEVTEFGLRTMATLLAGYLAIVFLGLFLTALRLVPSSIRALVDRWTTRGIAGGLRRCVGLSALAIGVLPLRPLAADATELAAGARARRHRPTPHRGTPPRTRATGGTHTDRTRVRRA